MAGGHLQNGDIFAFFQSFGATLRNMTGSILIMKFLGRLTEGSSALLDFKNLKLLE